MLRSAGFVLKFKSNLQVKRNPGFKPKRIFVSCVILLTKQFKCSTFQVVFVIFCVPLYVKIFNATQTEDQRRPHVPVFKYRTAVSFCFLKV